MAKMTEKFSQWNLLFWQFLKRDWKKIGVWLLGLGLFSGGFVPAFEELAKGQGLVGMYHTMQNPAMIAMIGTTPVKNVQNYTVAAMYANEMLLFCSLFAMILAALHVVSHTRKEEELGLTELIRSFRVGRQANSLAILVETFLINLVLGLLIGFLMAAFGVKSIDLNGSLLFGLSIALAGILGAVFGLLFAQIMPTAAGATGVSLGFIGLLYILRAGTDISNGDLSKINPMGWTYLTYPFTENNWIYFVIGLFFSFLIVLFSFFLEGKRDYNAGYLPEKEGRSHGSKALLSVAGWYLRINFGMIISWMAGFALMGAAYGSVYQDMQSFMEGNELVKQVFVHSGGSLAESFTGTIIVVMVALVAILPIAILNKLFTEESSGRMSQLFSTQVSRLKLYSNSVLLAVVSSAAGVLVSSLCLGATAVTVMENTAAMPLKEFLAAGFNFLPVVLFFAGLAAFCLGFVPNFSKVVYVYLGYSFAISYFGGILNLPEWFSNTSALKWLPQLPTADFDFARFGMVTVISCVLLLLGFIGYKRRDLQESA